MTNRHPSATSLAVINRLQPGQLSAEQKKRLSQLLGSPGTRAKVADRFLSSQQRQQRALNTRLNQPVTPGSMMTERDLARSTQSAADVRYGPQESQLKQNVTQAQQISRDVGDYYDAYLKELAQHQANVAGFQSQAQQALAGITGAVGGLGSGAAQGLQGDNAGNASNASAVRQALAGSFGAQQALQGASANTYADAVARQVGPGQKVQALTNAKGNEGKATKTLADLLSQKGAFRSQLASDTRQGEAKNVLAQRIAGVNATTAEARIAESARHNKASEQTARERARTSASNAKSTGYGAGRPGLNKYGYTYDEWNALSGAQQAKARAGKGKPKAGSTGQGPDWLPQGQMSAGLAQLPSLKDYASRAKTGQPFQAGHAKQQALSRSQAAQKITQNVAAPKDPILITAALDAVYDQHLSAATVKKLIAAGYKPSRVAQTLGVPTAATYKKAYRTGTARTGGN